MNNETEEILQRIDLTLKSGQNEILFRKKELDSNPAKQSVIDWLKSLKIISIGAYCAMDSNCSIGNIPYYSESEPFPHKVKPPIFSEDPVMAERIIQDNDRRYREWKEKNDKRINAELDKMEWQIPVMINKEKFQDLYQKKNLSKDNSKKTNNRSSHCLNSGPIKIDLLQGTLTVKRQSYEIALDRIEIKFLILLIKKSPEVIEYKEMLKEIVPAKVVESPKKLNNINANTIKGSLWKYLKNKVKVPAHQVRLIKKMIKTKTNLGYKFVPNGLNKVREKAKN